MTIASSLPNLQAALYTALNNNSAYMALAPGLYDAVPQTPIFPHTVIGDAVELSDRMMGQIAHEVLLLCSIYTRDGSTTKAGTGNKGFAAGIAIAERQVDLLVEQNVLSVTGHAVVMVEVESIETYREDDGITRRVDVRYRVLIEVS